MKISVLLIGLGRVGMAYDMGTGIHEQVMSHARSLAENSQINFVGAVDPDSFAREQFTNLYQRPSYETIEEALSGIHPEVVVIASPTRTHLAVVKTLCTLSAPSLILCEKPISYGVDEAKQILEICQREQVKLFVNYMRRSDPATWAISQALSTQQLGSFNIGVCFYAKGVIHNASHFVDLLSIWFGEPRIMDSRLRFPEQSSADDALADFSLNFGDLLVDFRSLGNLDNSPSFLTLWGPTNRIDYDWGGKQVSVSSTQTESTVQKFAEGSLPSSSMHNIQTLVTADVVAAFHGEKVGLCTGEEAVQILQLCNEILHQAQAKAGHK